MSLYGIVVVVSLIYQVTGPQVPEPKTVYLQGRVIQLGPFLSDRWDIPVDSDMGKSTIVLHTKEGTFHPIIKDVGSRGFFMDKRLLNRPMELQAYQYPGLPYLRLISTFSFKSGKRYRVDYWCTICSISTFEPGPCPCCQDEIELREVLVGGRRKAERS